MVYMLGSFTLALVMSTGDGRDVQRIAAPGDRRRVRNLRALPYDAHNLTPSPPRAVDIDENVAACLFKTARRDD